MESHDGEMSATGPWGGHGGIEWSYKPKHGITQIIVIHTDKVIDSLIFQSETDRNGSNITFTEYSRKFGGESGKGGTRTEKVSINFPNEYLTGISGFTHRGPTGPSVVVKSLQIYTNRTEYGPFGDEFGDPFFFRPKGCVITGFYGRSGWYIDAIGVNYRPLSSVFVKVPIEENSHDIMPNIVMSRAAILLRNPAGPCGGQEGRLFDDGVFSEIKQVHVHLCNDAISAVQFEYVKKNGEAHWSPMHGAGGGTIARKIEIDHGEEFLTGIEGFYGPIQGSGGIDVVKSLTFYTNKGKYGPLGKEIGKFFSYVVCYTKVVGFYGKCGEYLNSIGVHVELLNNAKFE